MFSFPLNNAPQVKFMLLVLNLCFLIGVICSSFTPESTSQGTEAVKKIFIQDVASLQEQAKQLTQTLHSIEKGKATVEQGRAAFYQVKDAYKKTEYLLEYLDPELAKGMNGAPLPKVLVEEANYQTIAFQKPSVRTFPPQGLQVLEEILFSDSVSREQVKEAIVLAYALEEKAGLFSSSLYNQPITVKQLLESLREETLRVMTMGITGFDAPAAGREMEFSASALRPVKTAVELYGRTGDKEISDQCHKISRQVAAAITYLEQHPRFETFDRMYFIRELLDPVYASLTRLQQQVLPQEAAGLKPVNDKAFSLFSPDFLQTAFYAKQDRQEQKPELVNLGKTLFFDPLLSSNNKRSCASCHSPEKGFADGVARSVAFDFKGTLKRNSPTLLNAIYSTAYFWDSRAQYLQDQVPDVLVKSDELHGDYEEVVHKLKGSAAYRKLFKQAFSDQADQSLNTNTINRAIAAYVQNLVALDSPFDKYMRGETEHLSAEAKRGFNLFMGKAACGTCHFAPIFNGTVPPRFLESESEILGIPATADLKNPTLDQDPGKGAIIPAEVFRFSFKTPTVRNVGVTAPYMHNGVFTTLNEVMEFYDQGGGAGLGMDVPHQTLPSDKLELTAAEKQDLIAFMHSLTDTTSARSAPKSLPTFFSKRKYNSRPVGGEY
ncbi:cytochrome-c peroxidase [Rufibacter tibetensis]|uniref:cytochrome-c peroxidase n=1 Tax=Rufibacter tibetensis TaxID=512763 RepID=UPI0007821018|nr:cytochrome c peroxidase [Rufibacter tibetensis]